ncbi:Protein FAM75A4 [Pteropus alecto]|uniref:Protein FAM75A4 n=1 Tax=Pteropus alecto TaxID=9402 RepID=L5KDX5_PTEAL|nr:Protein FAM75A4 [Pteropus alecto]
MIKPLGDDPDTLWRMKGKPEKLLDPEKHPHPETFETNLQQKCSQLFWGLPFMYSESLVDTVRETPPEFPSVIFNEFPHALPLQIRRKVTSHLTLAQPLPHPVTQPKLLTPAMPAFQPPPLAQIQTQTHLPPFSPPQTRTTGVSCPTSQDKARSFIPISYQDLEPQFWKKQLEGERSFPFLVKKSQAVFSKLNPNFPQENGASHTPRPVSLAFEDVINPEILEQLEQHLQKRFVQHRHVAGLPHWVQLSLDLPQMRENSHRHIRHRASRGHFSPLHL